MKRFAFPLESVRRYRASRAVAEQARFEQARAIVLGWENELTALADSEHAARTLASAGGTGGEMRALASTLEGARFRRDRLLGQLALARAEAARREQAAATARRELETLERARDKAKREWAAACDREMESEAAELHLTREARRRAASRDAHVQARRDDEHVSGFSG